MKKQPKIKPAKSVLKQGTNKEFVTRQWEKGQSGNPKGREPLTKSIPDLLRRFGKWQCPDSLVKKMQTLFPNAKSLTVQEAVYLRVYTEALQGEAWAVQFIAERTEGKITQPQEITLPSRYDLTKLTSVELLALKQMQKKIEIKDKADE